MEINTELRDQIFEVVTNQLKSNDPPETKITYDRLEKEGFDDFTIMQMIGQCVACEIYDIMKDQKPFNLVRYLKNLENLPEEPFD